LGILPCLAFGAKKTLLSFTLLEANEVATNTNSKSRTLSQDLLVVAHFRPQALNFIFFGGLGNKHDCGRLIE